MPNVYLSSHHSNAHGAHGTTIPCAYGVVIDPQTKINVVFAAFVCALVVPLFENTAARQNTVGREAEQVGRALLTRVGTSQKRIVVMRKWFIRHKPYAGGTLLSSLDHHRPHLQVAAITFRMSPHRALTVSDVLHEVFKHFATHPWLTAPGTEVTMSKVPPLRKKSSDDDEADAKEKRRTLAHATRACKAFAEPASRVLWEIQDRFGPIMSVLKNTQVSGTAGSRTLSLTTF